MLDAVKVTTYVNFELETSFIVELAKNALAPINAFPNDISKKVNLNLDFRDIVPSSLNIEADLESYNSTSREEKNSTFAIYVADRFTKLVSYIDDSKDIKVSNSDFISLVNDSLISTKFTSDPKLSELINVWNNVQNLTYSKEQKLTDKLVENNNEKYDILKDILNKELLETKKLKNNIENL